MKTNFDTMTVHVYRSYKIVEKYIGWFIIYTEDQKYKGVTQDLKKAQDYVDSFIAQHEEKKRIRAEKMAQKHGFVDVFF